MKRKYGYIPDLGDHRDFKYTIEKPILLPISVDLRSLMPPVYDQGQLGSCTANAIAGAIQFEQIKQKIKTFIPSRLFIYYNERVIENTIASDSGSQIRDGIKSVNSQGVCPEAEWPYIESRFIKKPTAKAYKDALKNQVLQYQAINQSLNDLKTCLASGYPFVFGFTVYDSFESDEVAKTGIVNLPSKSEQSQGGHAVVCVGYDDISKRFIVRNSWAADWGQQGYFTMPYEYILNNDLADDFWKITLVK